MTTIAALNIGKNVKINVFTPNGELVASQQLMNFSSRQDTTLETSDPIDGRIINTTFYHGWSGEFDIQRADSSIDDFFNLLEDNYFQGQRQLPSTITETIQEVSGSVTEYVYSEVTLTLESAGEWRTTEYVTMRLRFKAGRRQKLL